MIMIDRKAVWILELAWLVAFLAELGHERQFIIIIAREYLHSMIPAFNDKQEASMMVEYQAKRTVEQAIITAVVLGADRELDSSITIKSIVSHLFHFNLSLSLSLYDKEMIQAPNCSTQRDEDMKLSHTRHKTRDTRHETPSKQASKQQEATRTNRRRNKEQHLPPSTNQSLTHTSLFFLMMMYLIGVGLMTSSNMSDIKRIGDRV